MGRPLVAALVLSLLFAGFQRAALVQAVTYPPGWNLVAGPGGSIVQGASALYALRAGDAEYEQVDQNAPLVGCQGYWAYFPLGGNIVFGDRSTICRQFLPPYQWVLLGNPSPSNRVSIAGANTVLRYTAGVGWVQDFDATLSPGEAALIQADQTSGGRVDVLTATQLDPTIVFQTGPTTGSKDTAYFQAPTTQLQICYGVSGTPPAGSRLDFSFTILQQGSPDRVGGIASVTQGGCKTFPLKNPGSYYLLIDASAATTWTLTATALPDHQ